MQLIAGLGNPGSQYERNRHNVGFMAVDELHRHHSFSPWRRKFQALIAEGRIGGEKTLVLKPATFMNESGRALAEAARFYKIAPHDILVIYDDLDLAPGKIRMKRGGGHGGHNGIRSIHAHLGPDYRRLRIGIGHPGDKKRVHNWVLSDFARSDDAWLEPLLGAIAANADALSAHEDDRFASKVHLALGGGAAANPKQPKTATKADSSPPPGPAAHSNPFTEILGRLFRKSDESG